MSYLNKNLQGRKRVQKNVTGTLDLDSSGTTGPNGATGPTGANGVGSTAAQPFLEGIVYGKTLNDTVSLGLNGNFNNLANNVTIGNNTANSLLGYSNNSIVGNKILQNYNQSNVTNNAMLGTNIYNNTTTINNISDNIVIGSNISANTGSDIANNILLGRNITSNCEDSIIINTGNTGYNSNFNNTFYLGDGINQPSEDNNLFVDNNYDKYIIKDIPSPLTNVYYFNYSITATNKNGSNTLDPQTSNGPFPVDTFSTYADLNQGPAIFPEVQFPVLINTAKLLSDYAYITPFGNPNLTTFPAGNWNIKAYISTDISGACQVTPRFYKYNNGVETFLFNGNTVPIVGSGIITVNIPTSQGSFAVNKDDRLVVKVFAEPIGVGPFPTLTLYLEGESPWTLSTPFVETPYLTNFLIHYDAVSGNITKQMINNVSDSPSSVKVLKRSVEGTLFRNFVGGTGINVNQLTDNIEIAVNSSIIPVAKRPIVLGTSFGLNVNGTLFSNEICGRNSFTNYTSGIGLNGITALGNDLFSANTSTSFLNSIILGRTLQYTGLTQLQNSFLALNSAGIISITQINRMIVLSPVGASFTTGFSGQLNNSTIISTGDVSCLQDPAGSVVLTGVGNYNVGGGNMLLSSGNLSNNINISSLNSNTLIHCNSNPITYTMPSFSECSVISNSISPVYPTANSQFCLSHSSINAPNLNNVTTFSTNTLPMSYDPVTDLISPISSVYISRVWRAVALTVAGGSVNFTPGASINPSTNGYGFQATVRNSSGTVAYVAQIQNVNATTVTVQVFQSTTIVLGGNSMVPAGANILVHFSMYY